MKIFSEYHLNHWVAYFDSESDLVAYGATAQEAIDELKDLMDERGIEHE